MDFADLLAKIANNARLTPNEMQELRLLARQTQENNSYTAGLQTGMSDIHVRSIVVRDAVQIGKDTVSGISARVKSTAVAQNIPSGSYTKVVWATEDYDTLNMVDLSVSNTDITIRITGIYQVSMGVWLTVGATGNHAASTYRNTDTYWPSDADYMATSGILSGGDERVFSSGDAVSLQIFQNTGSAATLTNAFMAIRMIRTMA